MTHALRVITNSELRVRRRCAREHHYSYELGYRSANEDVGALRFGTLVHLALEGWWSAPDLVERLPWALAQVPDDVDPFERVRVVELLRGYDIRWRDEPLQPVELIAEHDTGHGIRINGLPAVECEFRAPLINPATGHASQTFQLGGKLDALVRDLRDGRVYILEHKTSGDDISAGSLYWQLLQLDTQVSMYYAGARALGFEPAGVIYDVLGKPRQKPKQATPVDKRKYRRNAKSDQPWHAEQILHANQRFEDETPDEYAERVRDAIAADPDHYYVRGNVVRLDTEETDAQFDTWQHARAMREAQLAQRWPRNPDACRRFNRLCVYFGVCSGSASLDDQTLFRRVENVHQELTQERDQHDAASGSTTTDPTVSPSEQQQRAHEAIEPSQRHAT